MLFMMGILSVALLHVCRQYFRQKRYASAMAQAAGTASVLIRRQTTESDEDDFAAGTVVHRPLTEEISHLMSDAHLIAQAVTPKPQVDLTDWTAHMAGQEGKQGADDILVLLEARRLDNPQPSQVPVAFRVHALKHSVPVAWKDGCPFGVILRCSYQDFVKLCDAFGQGYLTLDDTNCLDLLSLQTVTTEGKPKFMDMVTPEEDAETEVSGDSHFLLTAIKKKLSAPHVASPCAVGNITDDGDRIPACKQDYEADDEDVSVSQVCSGQVVSANVFSAAPKNDNSPLEEQQGKGDDQTVRISSHKQPLAGVWGEEELKLINGFVNQVGIKNRSSFHSNEITNEIVAEAWTVDRADAARAGEEAVAINRSIVEVDRSSNVGFEAGEAVAAKPDPEDDFALNSAGNNFESGDKSTDTESQNDSISLWVASLEAESIVMNCKNEVSKDELSVSGSFVSVKSTRESDSTSVKTDSDSRSLNLSSSPDAPQQDDTVKKEASSGDMSVSGSFVSAEEEDAAVNRRNSLETEAKVQGLESLPPPAPGASGGGTHTPVKVSASAGHGAPVKPPNVIVYCGNKDTARRFGHVKTMLEQCLNMDMYTIHHVSHDDFVTTPWESNSAALVVAHDYLYDSVVKKCSDYLRKGGRVLSFGSSLEAEFVVRKEVHSRPQLAQFDLKEWHLVSAVQGRHCYTLGGGKKTASRVDCIVKDPTSADALAVCVTLSDKQADGKAVFSQLLLERDPSEVAEDSKSLSLLKQSSEARLNVLRHFLSLLDLDTSVVPPATLTPCYLLAQDQTLRTSFLNSLSGRLKEGCIKSQQVTLKFVSGTAVSQIVSGTAVSQVTAELLPVITDSGSLPAWKFFDPNIYWSHLTSRVMGRIVMYTDVVPTTMTLFSGIQFSILDNIGVIAIAGRQTRGKGRSSNAWISPAGCAMFTIPLSMAADSLLGQRSSFIQHIMSLAVVHAIRSIQGYQDLDLRLKWPNDIYFGSQVKLGGVLVNSTVMGNKLHAIVGCGVNVSNDKPTLSINSIIEQHNKEQGTCLKHLTTSEVIACTVSTLEYLLATFQETGYQDFCPLYYKYWLHIGGCVRVESEGNAEVDILGLDDYGFLRVVNRRGEQFSLHPDGNSFDMLHNLITTKS